MMTYFIIHLVVATIIIAGSSFIFDMDDPAAAAGEVVGFTLTIALFWPLIAIIGIPLVIIIGPGQYFHYLKRKDSEKDKTKS